MSGTPNIPISQQETTRLRVDFHDREIDILVRQKGLRLYTESSMKCACRGKGNGNPNPICINCNGCGFVFFDKKTVYGIIQAVGYNPKVNQYSELNVGTATLTLSYGERVGWMDRVTVRDGDNIFEEMCYPKLKTVGIDNLAVDLLVYEPTKMIRAEMYVDEVTPNVVLVEGTDYTIEGRKLILSTALRDTLTGTETKSVSVRYKHLPTYLVMDVQRDIRNTVKMEVGGVMKVKNLPIFATLKKIHYLVGDNGYQVT